MVPRATPFIRPSSFSSRQLRTCISTGGASIPSPSAIACYSHTLWVPLEQVHLRNGPIAIVPWKLGRFMSPQELGFDRFLQGDDQGTREDYHQYQDRLLAHIR